MNRERLRLSIDAASDAEADKQIANFRELARTHLGLDLKDGDLFPISGAVLHMMVKASFVAGMEWITNPATQPYR